MIGIKYCSVRKFYKYSIKSVNRDHRAGQWTARMSWFWEN